MIVIKVLLILLEVLCSLLLVGVILLQRSKGEGLGLAFGAEMGESLFGARASNVLVKITIWLGVIFLVNTTVLARIYAHTGGGALIDKYGVTKTVESPVPGPRPTMPPAPVPSAGTPAPTMPMAPTPVEMPALPSTAPAPTAPANP